MTSPITLSSLKLEGRPSAAKVRLTICLTLFGASLGAAGMLISFMARTKFPIDPAHLDFQSTIILTPSGAIAGALLAALLAWTTTHRDARRRGLVVWVLFGFLFGVLVAFASGIFLPYSTAMLNVSKGVTDSGDLTRQLVDAAFRMPSVAVIQGVYGLFTGMLMGALLMLGGILMERTNISQDHRISAYLTYVIAVALSAVALAVAAYAPADILAKLF